LNGCCPNNDWNEAKRWNGWNDWNRRLDSRVLLNF
jgi:hypothetical protein